MRKYDPIQTRHILLGDCGAEFCLACPLEESKALGGLASSSDVYVTRAIQCLLVGLEEFADPLLRKAVEWIELAISIHEKPQHYGPNGTEALRFQTLALCNWLLHGKHDTASLWRFVEYEDAFLATSSADKVEISFILPYYVDAGADERVLTLFENTRGMRPAKSLSTVRTEGQMAYVLSSHRFQGEYSEEEVEVAAQRFLDRCMNAWLVGGNDSRAAEWMKIVHWREGNAGLSPKETVLKCHDHLKNHP